MEKLRYNQALLSSDLTKIDQYIQQYPKELKGHEHDTRVDKLFILRNQMLWQNTVNLGHRTLEKYCSELRANTLSVLSLSKR